MASPITAINQWQVASLQPPHLKAMCIWEGAADWYRDMTHHGGILSTFWANWYDMQVKTVQYGLGERGPRSGVTGALVCGDETLSDDRTGAQPLQFRRRYSRPSARRRLPQGALAGLGQGDGAAAVGGKLGRPGPAPARKFRRLCSGRVEAEVAGVPWPRALDAFLYRLRARAAEAVLRLSTSRAKPMIGIGSREFNSRSAISTVSSSGMRPTGRCPQPSGPNFISTPPIRPFRRSRRSGRGDSALPRWATG